ncbi:MAG: divalent metal cation transporter [Myxococcales bacterium]|nr:divalent metal cation transporter [Myxococcales bacterium]
MQPQRANFWKSLGPGLLFAGTAVGVSHLVQSTRAGAGYGLALVGFVILANVLKYPAFSFAPRYAAATGTSLLEAYRRQGRWALALYGLVTLGTMFAVQAAVVIVAAGLAQALFGDGLSVTGYAIALTAIAVAVNGVGSFALLDRLMKLVVVVLTASTLVATALVIPQIPWGTVPWVPDVGAWTHADLFFVVGLIGWMPTALDVGVWHSLWTLARRFQTGHAPRVRECLLDFNIGYIGTAFLALCFLVMGAGVMYGRGVAFESSPGGFARQLIALYTENLGSWSGPMIAAAAFGVMFSTVLSVVDGFPRALSGLLQRFRAAEIPHHPELQAPTSTRTYNLILLLVAVGALGLVAFLEGQLKVLVGLATSLSFLTAPVFAILNHRAVQSRAMPLECRPRRWMIRYSLVGIAFQVLFAVYFLWILLFAA